MSSYAVPAVVAWGALGLLANAIPLRQAAAAVIVAYCGWYGLAEAAGWPRPFAPSSRWQVPKTLVLRGSPWRRMAVWGSILGPGFATRNPYAGFAVLPLAVAAVGNIQAGIILAIAIGFSHATGRAVALLRDVRAGATADYTQSLLRSVYFRIADGYVLLMIGGAATIMCISRFA